MRVTCSTMEILVLIGLFEDPCNFYFLIIRITSILEKTSENVAICFIC